MTAFATEFTAELTEIVIEGQVLISQSAFESVKEQPPRKTRTH
jgi:hypothetical protein